MVRIGSHRRYHIADHISLAGSEKGYRSFSAQSILAGLAVPHGESVDGVEPFGINYRTLGDVGYFMASLNTPSEVLRATERRILDVVSS